MCAQYLDNRLALRGQGGRCPTGGVAEGVLDLGMYCQLRPDLAATFRRTGGGGGAGAEEETVSPSMGQREKWREQWEDGERVRQLLLVDCAGCCCRCDSGVVVVFRVT